jgi:hypothetical protein
MDGGKPESERSSAPLCVSVEDYKRLYRAPALTHEGGDRRVRPCRDVRRAGERGRVIAEVVDFVALGFAGVRAGAVGAGRGA